ncbi:hypothetical protein OH76DRAFT_1487257 [Lentinus brumalis]|uniref:F-box domain-containing protein n=1 Tax=Lentinus brumalis TaxID=2498619 RepID=A0A371CV68_9APHY|nr:hypothetical protein OH76DRAFT_1487257 [Polyporus brumalis]
MARLAELRVCQCKRCAVAVSDLRAFWSASPVPASLRTLAVAVKDIPHGFVTDGLRSLQELIIHGTAGDIAAFIRSIQPTQLLHTVSLKFWRDPNHGPDDAIPSQALVSICRSLPSVQSLEVTMDVLSSELTYPPFPLTAVVATLRPLKNLAGFTLHAGLTHITEVEEGLQMLAERCPSLRSLKIAQSPGLYSPAAVTLRSLASVARSFPQLESLSLPRLDAAELLSTENDVPVLAHGLRLVEFPNVCGIPDPSPVAHAISRLFPLLQIEPSTGVEGILGGEWHGEWAHVRALLCKMHGKS